jgi:hypothetical protein
MLSTLKSLGERGEVAGPIRLHDEAQHRHNDVILHHAMVGDPCSKSAKNRWQRLAHRLLFLF